MKKSQVNVVSNEKFQMNVVSNKQVSKECCLK